MANSSITTGQLEQLADMISQRLAKQPRCLDKNQLAEKLGVTLAQAWVEEREADVDFSD